MAASFVMQGAVPVEMFNSANTEHFAIYAKLRPFLPELRSSTKYPDYLSSLEQVVTAGANAEDRIGIFERYMIRQRTLAAEGKQRSSIGAPAVAS